MSDPSRRGASRDLSVAGDVRSPKATPAAGPRADGAAGLRREDLVAMLRDRAGDPVMSPGDPQPQEAIAPYLSGTELSAEAYNEWLARVCEQPGDD